MRHLNISKGKKVVIRTGYYICGRNKRVSIVGHDKTISGEFADYHVDKKDDQDVVFVRISNVTIDDKFYNEISAEVA